MSSLNVCTILGDRLDLSSLQDKITGAERVVRTQSGREIRAELVVSPTPLTLSRERRTLTRRLHSCCARARRQTRSF